MLLLEGAPDSDRMPKEQLLLDTALRFSCTCQRVKSYRERVRQSRTSVGRLRL